ncbi:MAG: hypothetical protein GXO08_02695 [Aquificae bacterium]|nr:hypothetical protein [Aquificota bacterium]
MGLLFGLLLGGLALLVLTPKYLWLEKLVSEKGLFLKAQTVRENLWEVQYYGGEVYYREAKAGNFTVVRIKFLPLPELTWRCSSGWFKVSPNLPEVGLSLEASDFSCSSLFRKGEWKVKLLREEVFGRAVLYGVKIERGLPAEELERLTLRFEGKRVYATVEAGGLRLSGEGRINWKLADPFSSTIYLTLKGQGFTLTLKGPLFSPRAEVR